MNNSVKYNQIEFSGSLLDPSFAVYLFEIIHKEKGRYFYVGMTGDPHYPSARSALHRIAGHIDLANHSTQNQFLQGLRKIFNKEKGEDPTSKELAELQIKFHHFPISGYVRWKRPFNVFWNKDKEDDEYIKYKQQQTKVFELEQHLIYLVSKKRKEQCLNSKGGRELTEVKDNGFEFIVDKFQKIISQ